MGEDPRKGDSVFLLAAGLEVGAAQSLMGAGLGLVIAAALGGLLFTSTRRLPAVFILSGDEYPAHPVLRRTVRAWGKVFQRNQPDSAGDRSYL